MRKMWILIFLFVLINIFITALGWAEPSTQPSAKQKEEFVKFIDSEAMNEADNWDKKEVLLQAALTRFGGTPIETAVQIHLAHVEFMAGKKKQAEVLLSKAGEDDNTRNFYHNPMNFMGSAKDDDIAFINDMSQHFDSSPNVLGDEALCDLYQYQLDDEDYASAWKAAARLISRYPEGDRVKSDQEFVAGLSKKFPALPQRFRNFDSSPASECFQRLRRPHMEALLIQLDIVSNEVWRKKANATDADGALAAYRLLTLYSFLLSDSEVGSVANRAIIFLDRCKPGEWKGPKSIEETKKEITQLRDAHKQPTERARNL